MAKYAVQRERAARQNVPNTEHSLVIPTKLASVVLGYWGNCMLWYYTAAEI